MRTGFPTHPSDEVQTHCRSLGGLKENGLIMQERVMPNWRARLLIKPATYFSKVQQWRDISIEEIRPCKIVLIEATGELISLRHMPLAHHLNFSVARLPHSN